MAWLDADGVEMLTISWLPTMPTQMPTIATLTFKSAIAAKLTYVKKTTAPSARVTATPTAILTT